MGAGEKAVDADGHKATLIALTRPGGSLDSDSGHSTHKHSDWFDADGEPSRERQKVHRKILREFFAQNVAQGGQAIMTAGPPGAGKSTALNDIYARTGTTAKDWLVLDADGFKDRILKQAIADGSYDTHLTTDEIRQIEAGGEKIWPRERAALVHEESSYLMKAARNEAIRQRRNIIIDGTMSSESKSKELAAQLERSGYQVKVVLVDAPKPVTEARADYRWRTGYENAAAGTAADPDDQLLGGRFVPAQIIDGMYRDESESVCAASARATADGCQAVTEFDSYRVEQPAGAPEHQLELSRKRDDGRWGKIRRHGAELARRHEKAEARKAARAAAPPPPTDGGDSGGGGAGSGTCAVCGRPLRSAASIARGAGPTCAGHLAR